MLKTIRSKLFGDSAQRPAPVPVMPNFVSEATGAGTGKDHNWQSSFVDTQLSQLQLEIIYRSSWAARKMIDIPVDDMFVPGRHWTGDDEAAIEAMEEAEQSLQAHERLRQAMKAGRLYGSGLLLIISSDASPETPLETVGEGSIANLIAVDRWAAAIETWHIDPMLPMYGKPHMYRIAPRLTGATAERGYTGGSSAHFFVHHSRVLRFDGIRPPLSEGWNGWDRDWGASELLPAINQIARDEHMHIALAHLLQEASIMVVKIQGFKQALQGRPDHDDPPLPTLASGINALKSIFRTGFIDREDDIQRLQVAFGGISQILDAEAQRMAAIADIPMTRFYAQSPAGQNATGDSDWRNYAVRVQALQETLLTAPLKRLDEALAGHAGVAEPPEYEWRPLIQTSAQERAQNEKMATEAITAAVTAGLITEEEARERLSSIELFGELGPMSDEVLTRLRRIVEGPPELDAPPDGVDKGGASE